MVFQIITIVAILSLLIYLFYLRLFYSGLKKKDIELDFKKKKVSVVIAARNEEKNIPLLLTSLMNQTYPKELFEVVIADDDSNDKTAEIVQQFQEKWDNIHFIKTEKRQQVISPKKNALSQGIKASSGDIILCTDADCVVGKFWIESMVSYFKQDTQMVCGFSRTKINEWNKAVLSQKFEHFDFLVMMFAAAGAISSKKYFSCTGQNLAYRRKTFESVGGFERIKHLISGDDVNLVQLFRHQNFNIRFAFSPHSFTLTKPIERLAQLLNQRSRWASNMKWQIMMNPEFFVYLMSVFFLAFLPIVLFFFNWKIGVGILLIKAFSDFLFIKEGYRIFPNEKARKIFFPFWFILQPVYILVVTFLGILNIFRWKK
ncbi:MAG: glycosyltransferase [Armatimonadetes bacterium]|nr:glycosyltransferase [Armatimonadota bacterium]